MGVLESAGGWAARLALVAVAALSAYGIRTYAIEAYGPVIHEFDPWFNFRATQDLADHGFHDFFHWCAGGAAIMGACCCCCSCCCSC